MTKEQLIYRLIGTDTSKRLSEREECIIDKCLKIINDVETDNEKLYKQIEELNKQIIPVKKTRKKRTFQTNNEFNEWFNEWNEVIKNIK